MNIEKNLLKFYEEINNLNDSDYLKRVLNNELPLDETALYRVIRKVLDYEDTIINSR